MGRRQRVALACARLRKPKALLVDEATTSLDALTEQRIVVKKLGCTRIVVAHRLGTRVNADRIVVMKDGAIVETGTHRELLGANGHDAELLAAQGHA
jgi:ABC-type multidrug transport system fused ATPase/permease subunit